MYSPQSTQEMLVTLEAATLIERRRDPDDGRVRRAYLTGRGAKRLAEAHRLVVAIEERMLHGLTDAQRRDFNTWLVDAAAGAVQTPTG